jgi:hypothetical protein
MLFLHLAPTILGLLEAGNIEIDGLHGVPFQEAPFLTRLTFSWLSQLFDANKSGSLTASSLSSLPAAWKTKVLILRSYSITPADDRWGLGAIILHHWKSFTLACVLQAIASGITFYIPWLFRDLLRYRTLDTFIAMFSLITVGAIARNHAVYYFIAVGMQIKTTVIARIYDKVLNMAPSSGNTGMAMTLVDVDSQRLMNIMPLVHQIWTLPIQVLVCVISLVNILGPACLFAITAVMVTSLPGIALLRHANLIYVGYYNSRFDLYIK